MRFPEPADLDGQRISVRTEIVNLAISVTDNEGRAIAGLQKEDFSVTDNAKPQTITFFSGGDSPVSVAIVFDCSGSMTGRRIGVSRTALEKFIGTSHPQDEYFLIAFNDRAQLLLDHSVHGEEIIRQLERVEPDGNTSLYDAVYLSLIKLQTAVYKRKVMLIITDGQDNSSRYSSKEVLRFEKESGVMIYAVGILDGLFLRDRRSTEYRLEDLTKPTGGRSFYPTGTGDLDEIFERIASEIRHMYSVCYIPSKLNGNGNWHKLKVQVRNQASHKSVTVRARAGYLDQPEK